MQKNKFLVIALISVLTIASAFRMKMPSRFNSNSYYVNDRIPGILSTPRNTANVPLVIIVAGSGPTDKDGNSLAGVNCNSYLKLADSLAMNGVASYRFDKFGVGDFVDSTFKEENLRFQLYINDVKEIVNHFKQQNNFSKIILAGHSEGSLVAMNALANTDGFISIAGAGLPAADVIKKQLKGKMPEDLETLIVSQLDSLVNKQNVTLVNPSLASLFRPSVQPYLMDWFQYNPTKILANNNKPILVLQGEYDVQVDVDQAKLLAKANPKAVLKIIPKMNHVLVNTTNDFTENVATYDNPDLALNPFLVKSIVNFALGKPLPNLPANKTTKTKNKSTSKKKKK
jgi:uncharacterized protein